ncbi:MAG TPA: flagellin [Gammaproteobacteria bacterium]|nr:flagellin [Gammaproteobacteria bacterium]
MAQIINTNVMSLNSQRNLNKSQLGLATALNRLSSGLRINSAKDDAAGLAISERMTSQINGLNQAARNANDGISLVQTAEGALNEVTNMLQRIRELAIQSMNASNSATDRAALNDEVVELQNEIQRISDTTMFNGTKLLDGNFAGQRFQVGSEVNQTINVSIGSASSSDIGSYKLSSTNAAAGLTGAVAQSTNNLDSGTLEVYGNLGSATITLTPNESAYTVATNINNQKATTGVEATAFTKAALSGLDTSEAGTVTFNLIGKASAAISAAFTSSTDLDGLANAINDESGTTGITAYVSNTNIILESTDGYDIEINTFANTNGGNDTATLTAYEGDSTTTINTVTMTEGGAVNATVGGMVDFRSDKGFTVTKTTANTTFLAGAANSTSAPSLKTVANMDVLTVAAANDTVFSVDGALASVSSVRSKLGAMQSRFESTINNLQTGAENLSAARSRIRDADFAAETAELTRTQILQQAGTAMLAQANSIPQNVLSLLG